MDVSRKSRIVVILLAVTSAGFSCSSDDRSRDRSGPAVREQAAPDNTARNENLDRARSADQAAPDNTARNENLDQAKSADQAVENESDLALTQKIRQAIIADDALSTSAHNVKIIVQNGRGTLRGPVASAEEKVKVHELATKAAGTTTIVNELEFNR